MVTPNTEPDPILVESDDENVDADGLFSSLYSQLTCTADVEREIIKVKSEIEVTQRNNTELTKKYLEVSKTVSESQLPDLATREQYNQRNLKSQKHVRELQNKLKKLEERKKKIREQEVMNGYVHGEPGAEQQEVVTGQKTPEQGAGKNHRTNVHVPNVITGVYKKAVAKRRGRQQDKWGSDGAIDQSSGVVDMAETLAETFGGAVRDPQASDQSLEPSLPTTFEYSAALNSDDEEQQVNQEDYENASDRVDSVSNVSEHVQESLTKLKDDYLALYKEVEELRQICREGLFESRTELEKEHSFIVEGLHGTSLRIRQIDDRVDDKLDKFQYSSDERIKEIEERLDSYKYKMTRFEELQEQRRMEHPLTVNDIASRGRDVMSSVISLGLAMVSLFLFVFTTAVDCLKVFSENNALSTVLSLGLFGAIIAAYYYFDIGRTL